jgi:DNA repair exonuclease SbcCD nuclease subunit
MRFLATGDLQAHNWRAFSYINEAGQNSRLGNILQVLRKMREYGEAHGIRNSIFLGDIFEINDYIDVDVYDAVYRELRQFQRAIIVPGNHDISAIRKSGEALTPFGPFEVFVTVIKEPFTEIFPGVHCVPYHPDPQHMKETFRALSKESKRIVLLSHVSVEGGKVGPKKYLLRCPIKLRDLYPDRWDLILLSDFHTRQKLAKNVWYMGSPIQHTFGETHEPCFWDVEVVSGRMLGTVKKIPTNLPKFVRAFISKERFKQLARMAKHNVRSRTLSGNYVKVVLADGLDEEHFLKVAAALKFQVDFDRQRVGDGAPDIADLHFDPNELIERYVERNTDVKAAGLRLIALGKKLYEGGV